MANIKIEALYLAAALVTLTSATHAQNFGSYKIGMTSNEASKLGIYHCYSGARINKYDGKREDITTCQIPIGSENPSKYSPAEVIFDNKTKKIVEIDVSLPTESLNPPDFGTDPKNSAAMLNFVESKLQENYGIIPCEKNYIYDSRWLSNRVCLYKPNVIRTIEDPVYLNKGVARLHMRIEMKLVAHTQEYKKLLSRSLKERSRHEAANKHRSTQESIARDIQNGK